MTENPVALGIAAFAAILFAAAIIKTIVDHKRDHDCKIVEKYSRKLSELQKINVDYNRLESIQPEYDYYFSVDSKGAYDRFNFDRNILEHIDDHYAEFAYIVDTCHKNPAAYEEYRALVRRFVDPCELPISEVLRQNHIRAGRFSGIEAEMVSETIYKKPVTDPVIRFHLSYETPKGRNYYSKFVRYSIRDVEAVFEEIDEIEKHKRTAAYQRQLITPKMRHQILQRDGFRCVHCGRGPEDGVKLHVDHIIPVSKGGLSVPENLQTLCQDCNLGKGADYDPNEGFVFE